MSTRALRVRRPDAAPVSLFPVADATGKTAVMTLPSPIAGGELLIGFEAAVVRPISVSISQQAVEIANVPTPDDRLAAATLRPGEYLMTPIYAGGMSGDPLRARVEAGDSAFASLPRAEVGALAVRVSDDLCVEAPRAVVSSVERIATGSTSRQIAAVSVAEQGCQFVLAGLRPGAYTVELTSSSTGLKVKEPLAITSQAVTAVSLSAPTVRLFGRVTISKRPPASGTRVLLQPANLSDPDQETRVALQFDGTFEARVRVPGPYLVRLVSMPIAGIGATREVSLKEGYNELNWDVDGGTLKLGIKNWDRSSFVEVTLSRVKSPESGPTSQQAVSASEVTSGIGVQDELPVTIEALELAEYVIKARQLIRGGIPRVSTPVTVSLTSARSTAEVELELFPYESVIRLVDGSGQPVTGAQVRTVEGPVRETEPGAFSINGKHGNPGTEVQIRAPGYTPMCKAAPPNGVSVTVNLRVGQPAVLRYLGRDDLSRPVGQILPPGSDCWVSLSEFVHSLVKVSPTQVDVTIQNWPGGQCRPLSPSFHRACHGAEGIAVISCCC
jgi:hypothetical protein